MASLDIATILPRSLWERVEPILSGRWRPFVLAGAALAAALAIVALLWSWSSSYSVLYAGLSAEEGGRAIAALQKLAIPYRIAEGGRVILVPAADAGRARLQLALGGVPKQDGDQWALLDNESLGVSPFVEQVHYLRAIEAALSQTIRKVDGVVSASVKLALPKQTDFLADTPKPSASVMVQLVPGLQLTAAQAEGIAGLVAASVPGLGRDNVTIIDQSGRVLNQNGEDGLQQVPQQLAIAQDIERRYEASVTDLLVPVLGRGNFRVSADVDIDFSHGKESSIKYGEAHVLSQDESIHTHQPGGEAIGIPGALSNQPPETPVVAPNPAAAGAQPGEPSAKPADKPAPPPAPDTHRTTNYDIDRTVQYLERPSWTLRAINVAVLVNDPSGKPIPADRIQSIKTLVGSAIGVGESRHVAVVDLPFAALNGTAAAPGSPWWQGPWIATVERNGLLALAGLLLLFGGLLPLVRRVDASRAAIVQAAAVAAAASAAAAPARLTGPAGPGRLRPGIAAAPPVGGADPIAIDVETVRTLVINAPDRTAQVIKEWIARDRNRLKQAG